MQINNVNTKDIEKLSFTGIVSIWLLLSLMGDSILYFLIELAFPFSTPGYSYLQVSIIRILFLSAFPIGMIGMLTPFLPYQKIDYSRSAIIKSLEHKLLFLCTSPILYLGYQLANKVGSLTDSLIEPGFGFFSYGLFIWITILGWIFFSLWCWDIFFGKNSSITLRKLRMGIKNNHSDYPSNISQVSFQLRYEKTHKSLFGKVSLRYISFMCGLPILFIMLGVTLDPNGGIGFSLDGLPPIPGNSSASGSDQPLSEDALINWLIQVGQLITNIGQAFFDDVNGIFTPFLTLFGQIYNGVSKFVTDPINLNIFILGTLSTLNDLMGYEKTFESNAFERTNMQLSRLLLDLIQAYFTFQNLESNTNSNNAFSLFFWVLKTGSSFLTDSFSLANDAAKEFPSVQTVINQLLSNYLKNGLSIDTLTNTVRVVISLISIIVTVYVLYKNFNSLTETQKFFTTIFTSAYVLESFMKFSLYLKRIANPSLNNLGTEGKIYEYSAITDFAEMIGTLFNWVKN